MRSGLITCSVREATFLWLNSAEGTRNFHAVDVFPMTPFCACKRFPSLLSLASTLEDPEEKYHASP